jgi:hypothetical protein
MKPFDVFAVTGAISCLARGSGVAKTAGGADRLAAHAIRVITAELQKRNVNLLVENHDEAWSLKKSAHASVLQMLDMAERALRDVPVSDLLKAKVSVLKGELVSEAPEKFDDRVACCE